MNSQALQFRRLQSVQTSTGFQIHFEYDTVDPAFVRKVLALNNAFARCNVTENVCSEQASLWPSLSFSILGDRILVVDALGRQTAVQLDGGGRVILLQTPEAASAPRTFVHEFISGSWRVSRVSRDSFEWRYGYTVQADIGGSSLSRGSTTSTIRTDPEQGQTQVVLRSEPSLEFPPGIVVSRIKEVRNELGALTKYDYDVWGRLARVTLPELNSIRLTYDSRGNITSKITVGKIPGNVPDVVETAGYPAGCADPKTCNLPEWVQDGRGLRTEFTYDPSSGQVATSTGPAVNGVRSQTRYTYQPLYAWTTTDAGRYQQAVTPIWKLSQTSTCRSQSSCAGSSDELVEQFSYESGNTGQGSNLFPIKRVHRTGDGLVSASTSMGYTPIGDLAWIDGPLTEVDDRTFYRYDATRQLIYEVGPDPDAEGPLPRRAVKHQFNGDGKEIHRELGTSFFTDGSGFSFSEFTEMTYDSNARLVKTLSGRP